MTEYRYHTAEDVRQQGLYILATWEAFNEATDATKRMEAKAEELRLIGVEELRVREAAKKAVAEKSAEEWLGRIGRRAGNGERQMDKETTLFQ